MTSPENTEFTSSESFEERLKHSLEQTLASARLLAKQGNSNSSVDESLLVALSGGPDSTALLIASHQACQQLSIRLQACHVNHGLRGTESEEDEHFCQKLCQRLGVPFSSRKLNFEGAQVSEQNLRTARHQTLEKEAIRQDASVILFGHTADDQVETIVFRFFRGTALKGLIGIKAVRTTEAGLYFVRPLLEFSKADCLRYLTEKGVNARQDSSNLDERFTRNFLRHKILPLVKERFGGFAAHVENMRSIIKAEEEFFADLLPKKLGEILVDADDAHRWSRARFNCEPTAIRRRLVACALESHSQHVSFERIEHILSESAEAATGTITLDQAWRIRFEHEEIIWQLAIARGDESESPLEEIRVRVPGLNMVLVRNRALKVELVDAAAKGNKFAFPRSSDFEALVDLSRLKTPLVIRSRRSGDLITPFGMNEPIRLKRYLQTHKAGNSAEDRLHLSVLADGEEIIWVPGIGLSEKVRVTGAPTHRLSWLTISSEDMALG